MPQYHVMLCERHFTIVAPTEAEAQEVALQQAIEELEPSDLIAWEESEQNILMGHIKDIVGRYGKDSNKYRIRVVDKEGEAE